MTSRPECEQLVGELRRLRARSGLSLAALAARTPYSKSSWQRYLGGEQPVPRSAVEALCAVTGEPSRPLLALWELADAVWSGRAVRAQEVPVDGRGGRSPVGPSPEEEALSGVPWCEAARVPRRVCVATLLTSLATVVVVAFGVVLVRRLCRARPA
ncbi:helix-turn-helix domain-containing protein [Streptomyces sp. NPDC059828]|uniref:helix-turn-helix domain-containing protein n=1 Tax=Streptomyces sp. NPDC059828 TaxID=3346965 RepID=UPI00365B2082